MSRLRLVLSGTGGLVLSGTRSSSYREPGPAISRWHHVRNPAPSNHANRKESSRFLLTRCAARLVIASPCRERDAR
ncbi:hypothetical protein E5554_05140 [Sphingobium sp. PAMC28499]|nr:hypothetical protein E5554_05140 [Sphingobium sp. PAMC28499]